MAVSEVERAVADVRMGDLAADQTTAWRHHRGERRGDPALKDGGADKIAAAQERERARPGRGPVCRRCRYPTRCS